MELYKNFALGGLFQAGKRMAPPWGSFRRFTNIFKDPTGTFKPYGRGPSVANPPTLLSSSGAYGATALGPIASQFYRKGVLQLLAQYDGSKYVGSLSYLGGGDTLLPIMQPFKIDSGVNYLDIRKHMTYLPSGNLSSCTVARKAFINSCVNTAQFDSTKEVGGYTPEESYLLSFDGIRPRGAGLPTPWSFVDTGGVAGSFYVRGVYATIGMDGELIFSNYMQCRLSAATKDLYLSGYSAYPGTPRADVTGAAGVLPTRRRSEDHLFEKQHTDFGFEATGSNVRYFDKRFVKTNSGGASVVSVTSGEMSITNTSSSPANEVGDWVMCNVGLPMGSVNADLWMFKIKTLASTIVFEKKFKYLDRDTVTWVDYDLTTAKSAWDTIGVDLFIQFQGLVAAAGFSNIFLIVSYSTSATSGFTVNNIYPTFWDSAHAGISTLYSTAKVFEVPWAGVVSSLMADWYDSNVVKTTFPPVLGITNYKELLVGFDANAIYFNDVSLGGSTEMVSGLSNIIPFGTEYGDITSICGSEDFLFFSRERKNYVITGDIAGSNFNISECDLPVPGAYNARSVTNAWAGQVIFANRAGVFAVTSSGSIKDISEEIKGLFFDTNRDGNLFDKTIFKTITQTRTDAKDGSIFKFFLEDVRGFIILLTAKVTAVAGALTPTGSNMLVYNPKDNKFYEFEGWGSTSAEAIYGNILSLGVNRFREDGVMRSTEKQLVVTQQITVDQPSMDKQILQLKMFGEFTANTSDGAKGMTVGQINDFSNFDTAVRTGWKTNHLYTPDSTDIYAHKKRLTSSHTVATSLILESLATGSFTLDGMEIEGVVAQGSIKK